jgi:ATP-binding cassette subfamily C protein
MAVSESAYWSVRGLIDQVDGAREHATGDGVPALRRGIALRDVRVVYDGPSILDGASLIVPVGQLTVVIGPSGAGKSTVADVVMGLVQPAAGAVLIDDVLLCTLDQRRWRALIGYVPQETFLLHDTVDRNVTLGDPDLSPADAEAALRLAGAWEFVAALPDGTATEVGERGMRLSGGQRQRLALARALVRQPLVLVLDEATAALDPATEADVCRTLQGLRGRVTMLAVCHQGPLIDAADNLYRVSDGSVTAVRIGGRAVA